MNASMDAGQIARAVKSGEISALAVTQAALARIRAHDAALNCFTSVFEATALADAARIDAAIEAGQDPGPLAGVPVAVKNLYDVAGVVTLAGSKIRRSAQPAAEDATAVAQLKAAGAIVIGATNMDEFAYGFVTENEHDGPTHNPHGLDHVAGGSSGGSAAAVAAGLVPLSMGSDTNGSIRVPASFCGIFGLKPTFGRLSRAGAFPFVASLDHVGPFARSVSDLALVYDTLQTAEDPRDPALLSQPVEPASATLDDGIAGLRIGVLGGWFKQAASEQALASLAKIAAALGIAGPDIVFDLAETARSAAFVITASEGGNLHLPDLNARPHDYDVAVRDRLMAGAMVPASTYLQAQRARGVIRKAAHALFRDTDILLALAVPIWAPTIGQATMMIDGKEVSARQNIGLYTQPLSFLGLPIVTVPVVQDGDNMPIGVQVIAAPWAEATALRVARHLERLGVVAAPVAKAYAD